MGDTIKSENIADVIKRVYESDDSTVGEMVERSTFLIEQGVPAEVVLVAEFCDSYDHLAEILNPALHQRQEEHDYP